MRKFIATTTSASLMCSCAVVAISSTAFTQTAHAQALQPLVDVCTGLSVNDSTLRDILNTTVVPTATGVEALYDELLSIDIDLGLGLGVGPLISIDDVELGIADTLTAIGSGDLIGVSLLTTEGEVIAPGDCNLTADGYTLNEEGGIAIGGNQITGLGAGLIATAGDDDAIAFGNNASTDPTAVGSVAIGTNATVLAGSSVAIGMDSVADRGGLTDYNALGVDGEFTSVGTVSVGDDGMLRQITNVAPGTEASDAATVGQLQGAFDEIAAIDATLDDVVTYDDATHTTVTFDGVGGTTLTNVADGEVSAISSDAVNGSQLFATNELVDANADDIVDLQADVTLIEGDVAALEADVGVLQDTAVMYDDATQASVTLGGVGGTTITNLADGEVSAISTDAVNGSQLFATNELVDANADDIVDLQADVTVIEGDIIDLQADVGTLQDTAVMYDDATQTSVTLGGVGGTTITNVADGTVDATSTDAINGSQLYATNQLVDANTIAIQANADAIAAIETTGDPLGVAYDDATRTSITLEGAGGTTISNVADGELSATSDEAVNGSQLFATNELVDANADAIDDLDTRVTVNEGDIDDLDVRVTTNETDIANLETDVTNIDNRVTVNEGDIIDLGDDIDAVDARVTVAEGDINTLETNYTNIDARVTNNTNSITTINTRLDNVPVEYVSDTDPTMPSAVPTNTVALIGAEDSPVTLTNVEDGTLAADSTDAVNGSQLFATNQQVATNRVDIDQNTADIEDIENNLMGSTVVAIQYSDPDNPTESNGGTITNDVTLVGADDNMPIRVHNVAAGVAATDAVNVGQLQASMTSAMNNAVSQANDYTDNLFGSLSTRIDDIEFDLDEAREEAFSGTASALAVAGIPQTIEPGRSMVGGAIGHYRGETAFAIGASSTFNDGRGVVKAGATIDTHGKGGFNAGAGFSF